MNLETTVRAESLTRRFGNFVAVDALSFTIHAGEIWGFLGPNGSGKSTTIRMLCGVMAPSSGRAEVLGYDVARDPEAVKQRIGYMTQGSTLWSDLTVEEHMRFYAGIFGFFGAERNALVRTWMDRVGLTSKRSELAGSLSGGLRKRLALACTLLHRPRMLFLDEPTAGVDPMARREFWDLIVELADEGATVMVTTHYLDEAEHCNQLAFIYGGRIIARGSPGALKRDPAAGVTVELVGEGNVVLLDPIAELSFVRGVSLYGSSLHVTLGEQAQIAELREFLAERDTRGLEPRVITPSLEDVFAALVPGSAGGSKR